MSGDVAIEVNGESIGVRKAIRSVVVNEGLEPLERMARGRLIVQLAGREGVRVTGEQIQRAVDEWRYGRGLERVADTEAWLAANGITLEDVSDQMKIGLLAGLLAEHVTQGRIEPYFAAHSLEFDVVELSWILRPDEPSAAELATQTRDEGADFHHLARQFSRDGTSRPAGGYLGRLKRADLPKGVSPLLFAADPGDVVGPLRVGGGFALYLVEAVTSARLDEQVQAEIRSRLFDEWLAAEIRQAQIAFPILARVPLEDSTSQP